jgi:OmpA-OmpF porin, OOP family
MRTIVLLLFAIATTGSAAAQSKIPFLTPYPGSSLQAPETKEFEEYELMVGPAGKSGPKVEKVAGRVTRAALRGPNERSLREIFANYEEALKKAGFATVFRCMDLACGQGDTKEFDYFNASKGLEEQYIVGKKQGPQGPVYIAIRVRDTYSPYTYIHVIESKPMQTGLVQISALEMKNDLATTGHVALYNILFDTAKADIRSESARAVAEVAKLLKDNASLKIYVVGHTDNAGSFEGNMDLSKRRAEAVVKELTSKHGIATARLRAVGVGSVAPVASNRTDDGKQQNRRVELVEQ